MSYSIFFSNRKLHPDIGVPTISIEGGPYFGSSSSFPTNSQAFQNSFFLSAFCANADNSNDFSGFIFTASKRYSFGDFDLSKSPYGLCNYGSGIVTNADFSGYCLFYGSFISGSGMYMYSASIEGKQGASYFLGGAANGPFILDDLVCFNGSEQHLRGYQTSNNFFIDYGQYPNGLKYMGSVDNGIYANVATEISSLILPASANQYLGALNVNGDGQILPYDSRGAVSAFIYNGGHMALIKEMENQFHTFQIPDGSDISYYGVDQNTGQLMGISYNTISEGGVNYYPVYIYDLEITGFNAVSGLQRHFAHNYSRGVPINQGTQNLILPPNRNIIL